MHIGFDNNARLCHNIYYFEYKGIRFKLIQNNPLKWKDVLLTIIEGDYKDEIINDIYEVASEFLSALSWQNNARIKMKHLGGPSVSDSFGLKNARCTCRVFPEIPIYPRSVGHDICTIPMIETEEQKIALNLYRQALSSSNIYLSFLFFWQVLQTGEDSPSNWINAAFECGDLPIQLDEVKNIDLNEKKLGDYLYDDCRNAIAHIKRNRPEKVGIKLDSYIDEKRIAISTSIVKKYARFYVENKLKLTKYLFLVRRSGKGFPIYRDKEYTSKYICTTAYKYKIIK